MNDKPSINDRHCKYYKVKDRTCTKDPLHPEDEKNGYIEYCVEGPCPHAEYTSINERPLTCDDLCVKFSCSQTACIYFDTCGDYGDTECEDCARCAICENYRKDRKCELGVYVDTEGGYTW